MLGRPNERYADHHNDGYVLDRRDWWDSATLPVSKPGMEIT
jgi:hypothetical protein